MNLYVSISRPFGCGSSRRTIRMALHPGLPDVHTDFRMDADKRRYRMVYSITYTDFEVENRPLADLRFWTSCLGKGSDLRKLTFEQAVAWLETGVVEDEPEQ